MRYGDERGSIPEWVMLLVMGIGIVMALWAIVQPDLTSIVSNALNGPFVSAPSDPAPVVDGLFPVSEQITSMNSSGSSW